MPPQRIEIFDEPIPVPGKGEMLVRLEKVLYTGASSKPRAIASAARRLFADEELMLNMGRFGRERVLNFFFPKSIVIYTKKMNSKSELPPHCSSGTPITAASFPCFSFAVPQEACLKIAVRTAEEYKRSQKSKSRSQRGVFR